MFSTMSNKVTVNEVAHPRYKYRVRYPDGGKRKQKFFKLKQDANKFAKGERERIDERGTLDADITADERKAVIAFREGVADFPIQITLNDAIEFFLKKATLRHKSITCLELSDKLLLRIQKEASEKEGKGKRHIDDVTSRLKRFTDSYGDWMACDVSTDIIDEYLDELDVASQTKLNYRNKVNQMFRHGVKIGVCDSNPVEDSIKPKVSGSDIEVLKPTQVAELLSCANDTVAAGLAISFFAGLRASEIERLDWADIDLEEGHIDIKAKNSKSARRRIVTISDNLKEWLLPYEKHEGKVIGSIPWQWRSGYEEAREAAKIKEWPHNAGRHSFASYHLADHEDAGKTAFELGHTNQRIVYQHYRKLVKPKAAATYWSITPTEAENIIHMKGKKAS